MKNDLGLLIKLDRQDNVENLLKRVVDLGFHSCQISTYVPSLYTEETAFGRQMLYVNDGLGTTLFPARIGVKAEITVFVLRHIQ